MNDERDLKTYVRGCSQDHLAGWLWGIESDLAECVNDIDRAFLEPRRDVIVAELAMRERIIDPVAALRASANRFDLDRVKADITMLDLAPAMAAVELKRTGNNFVGRCPFPNHRDSSPSFKVSADGQLWYCWGCGVGGTIFSFCEHFTGCTSFVACVQTAISAVGRQWDSYRVATPTLRRSANVV